MAEDDDKLRRYLRRGLRPRQHYYAVQHLVDTGDLVEWRGDGFVARSIRYFTGGRVNHSSLVVRLPYECSERRFVIEAVDSGLEFKLLSSQLEKASGQAWWYRLKPELHHLRPKIGEWAFNRLAENSGYDYASLFRQIFGRVSLDARRFFCSEFVQAAYVEHGIISCKDGLALRPGDFVKYGIYCSQEQIL
jgi:hypothetical protein